MMSDFRAMNQKIRTLEGKNRTLGGRGCQKLSKIVGHHLCTFPKGSAVRALLIVNDLKIHGLPQKSLKKEKLK